MKKIKVVQILISAIVIILSLFGLFDIINIDITLPIGFILLGILNISNGYYSYINKKKGESFFLILSGLFVIFVAVKKTFF